MYYAKNLYINNELVTELVIPDTVTKINAYAFRDCTSLTSVTIPNSVTSIGDNAFYKCSSLKEVHISDIASWCNISFSDYYSNPLYYAKNLYISNELVTNLVIPDTVTKINDYAFYNCDSLTSITIPNSVTSIGDYAFYVCASLKEVHISDIASWCNISFSNSTSNPLYYAKNLYINNELVTNLVIPNTVTEIKNYAFVGCTSITSIVIPDSVISIGSAAFDNNSDLLVYNGYDNGYYIGNEENPYLVLVKAKDETITSCIIHENTKIIYDKAFYKCTSLTSVRIPEGVTSIGSYAFLGCDLLTSITIPEGVTSIRNHAFNGCDLLTSIIIPNSVMSIEHNAFHGCISLTSITIPEGVISIGDRAFWDCTSLTSITIPDSVTSIGSNAFYGCTSLTSVTIGDNVTAIGYRAFENCTSLTSVTIGNSVTSIGDYAFYDCTSLKEVHISDIASWCNISFVDYDSNPLYNGANLYINGELVTELVIPDTVTKINAHAFRNCTSLTSITIPSSVTSIGHYAFYDCTSLKEVHISDIASWCNISFSDYVTNPLYNGANLYINNELVTELVIPDTVTEIKPYAFYKCTSLTSVTFENTNGWYVTKTQGATSGTNVDVTNAATNVTNLKSTYNYYYWYRKVTE